MHDYTARSDYRRFVCHTTCWLILDSADSNVQEVVCRIGAGWWRQSRICMIALTCPRRIHSQL
jgi:hypothetical protein